MTAKTKADNLDGESEDAMLLHKPQRFFVALYRNGEHEQAYKTVKTTTTLPELPEVVTNWKEEPCCWEAWNQEEITVAWRGCVHDPVH